MRQLLVMLVLVACPTTAAADDVVLAPAPGATRLDAGAGSVVWSAPTPDARWVLMHFRAGVVSQLPIRSGPEPFDADLGTDRDGRPTVVYSRCTGEMLDACGIHAFTLGEPGSERFVGNLDFRRMPANEGSPSIHRGAIAYASYGAGPFPRLLMRAADGHVRELSGGSRQSGGGRATIEDLDLGPGGAAYVWRMSGGRVYGVGDATELRFAPVSGRMSVLLDSGLLSEGCGEYLPHAPTVGAQRIDYLAAGIRCSARSDFAAYDLRTGDRMEAPMPDVAAGHAGGGGARFWLRIPEGGAFPCQPTCDLMVSRGVTLARDGRVRGTGLAEMAEIPGHRWVRGRGGVRLLRPPARVECIPRRGGVLVSVGAVGNQVRLRRCGSTHRVSYSKGGRRHTFAVRVLEP